MKHLQHPRVNRTLCDLNSQTVKTMTVDDYLKPLMVSRREFDRILCRKCVRQARKQTVRL